MIREERNALFLLLIFTVAAGLFYLLVLRPVLSDATASVPRRPSAAAATAATGASGAAGQEPTDTRSKAARRMVGLKAWLRDAVSGKPLANARASVLDISDIADPELSLSPQGRLELDYLPASISFGLLLECDGYQSRRFPRLRGKARAVIDLGLVALEPLRRLGGRVRDADGAPVGDCVISLFPLEAAATTEAALERAGRLADALLKNAVATTQTDPEGAFRFQSLPPGLYAAYSKRRSFGSVLLPDLDLRYSDRRLQFVLRAARPIHGELLGPPGVEAITNGRLVAVEAAEPLALQLSAAITRVDEQGRFAVVGLSDAPHFLFPVGDQLAVAGHGPRILSTPDGVKIPAAPGLELRGTLTDTDRLPVAGALIEIRCSQAGALTRRAASATDGSFRLRGLSPGAASLLVLKDGLAPHRLSVSLDAPADGQDGNRLPPITLLPPAELSGRVLAGGQPLVGAVIRCSAHQLQTLTDGSGHYLLKGLPPGDLVILAEASGHARREVLKEVRLRGENRLDFSLVPGGSLRVLIKAGAGSSAVPLRSARVLALEVEADLSPRATPIRALTDSRGTARIRNLPADGEFVLMAHAPGHAPMRSQPFQLTDRLRRSGVALTLRPGGSIDGTCKDPEGRPIPGVRVRALRSEASALDRALLSLTDPVAWSGPDGGFSLSDLPAGSYRLWAGHSGRLATLSATARIQENTLLVHFDLELPEALDLEGRVLDPDGRPVAQARVSVSIDDHDHPLAERPLTTLTDADGRFHFLRPDADTLLLAAEADNRGQARRLLERPARPPFDLVLELP